jgi:uncharacterized damage-inducible protein DinB
MTYYGSKQLADAFRTVRNNTIAVAQDIPEDKYDFKPSPESRSVRQTLIHIAVIPGIAEILHGKQRLTSLEGFDFFAVFGPLMAEENKPLSKQEIIDLLRTKGDAAAQFLEAVPEEALAETVTFPAGMTPPTKTRFEMLLGTKEHEMHHRGQLMVMQRMLGIVPHLTRNMQARMAEMQKAKGA